MKDQREPIAIFGLKNIARFLGVSPEKVKELVEAGILIVAPDSPERKRNTRYFTTPSRLRLNLEQWIERSNGIR
jgi:hypothetical protein